MGRYSRCCCAYCGSGTAGLKFLLTKTKLLCIIDKVLYSWTHEIACVINLVTVFTRYTVNNTAMIYVDKYKLQK